MSTTVESACEILADYLAGKSKRRKTNPDHKASFSIGVQARCSCGWESSMWLNKGAKSNAASEWNWHREKCERAS